MWTISQQLGRDSFIQGESSQDTAASLKHAATRGQRTWIQNNRSGFNKRLHFNDAKQPETTVLHFICTVLNSPVLPYVSPLFMCLYWIYLSPKFNLMCLTVFFPDWPSPEQNLISLFCWRNQCMIGMLLPSAALCDLVWYGAFICCIKTNVW